jgi:hypothetical protein
MKKREKMIEATAAIEEKTIEEKKPEEKKSFSMFGRKTLNKTKTGLNLQTMKRIVEANFELETKVEKIKALVDDCYD